MPDIYGTPANDTINGTNERESIYALAGDDTIYGGDGTDYLNDDWINAGFGNDIVYGGTGGDTIYDESGNDIVYAGADDDDVHGSPGDDFYDGGTGYDILNYSGIQSYSSISSGIVLDLMLASGQVRPFNPLNASLVGTDTIINFEYIGGTNFDDQLIGNAGDHRFWGADGNDTLIGGGGNDELLGGLGNDVLDGGDGFDVAMFAGVTVGVTVSLAISGPQNTGHGFDTLTNIESIQGTYFDDVLIGGDQDDVLLGDPGDDRVEGGGGDDVIRGGTGSDILTGGPGADTFRDDGFGLNGDLITDFGLGDKIILVGGGVYYGSFSYFLSGSMLTYTGGSVTFGTAPSGALVHRITADRDIEISLVANLPANNYARPSDFNGDGRDDVLWRNSDGRVTDWLGQANGGFYSNSGSFFALVGNDWTVAGTGDFNGDGRDDILWRHDDGTVTDWLGQAGGSFIGNGDNASSLVGKDWTVVGTGDFNGDGRDDILWRHDNGTVSDWLGTASGGFVGNGGALSASVGKDWRIAGTGDFNGDGRDDILWRNANGTVTDWLGQANGGFVGNGANFSSPVGNDWQVAGTGDFNGDGRDDILWRHTNGTVTDWLATANGGFAGNGGNFSTSVGNDWQVNAIGDFNGDGRDDIFWRNANGTVTDWLGEANGSFVGNGGTAFTTLSYDWQVQPSDYLIN